MKKLLMLLVYYERPELVKNALNSIKELDYENWELAFIDDASQTPGEPIARSILSERELAKTTFYRCEDSVGQKMAQGGSRHGQYMNEAIINSDAEYFVIICDDDAIRPTYFKELDAVLAQKAYPYMYSKVMFFNPTRQSYKDATEQATESFAGSTYSINHEHPLRPICMIDGSQLVCNVQCFKDKQVAFPFPRTRMLDAAIYQQLYDLYGDCYPTKLFGLYKAAFAEQMGNVQIKY